MPAVSVGLGEGVWLPHVNDYGAANATLTEDATRASTRAFSERPQPYIDPALPASTIGSIQ